ncbi:MAG TPA: AmmeMemoRadiSam system protein B [Candidatus Didemnitutus sp.]|nr:AmmeMemoRadiSam system protein B [Candidatus Didemnitutus sp.]
MTTLPVLRHDVQISVHQEDGESYLVLHDPFSFADGPIMVHSDMFDVLQSCDGITTVAHLAEAADVAIDGPEMTRLLLFLRQMDEMGYFEGASFEHRKQSELEAWANLVDRPAVCADGTYPAEVTELRTYIKTLLGNDEVTQQRTDEVPVEAPVAILMPHIDFRVAPNVYGPGFAPLQDLEADLVVMIGTSHYWSEDAFILTEKNFSTPLGTVTTDVDIVRQLKAALPGVAQTDIAHRPEHSLELHLVGLQHTWEGRDYTIVPILVTMAALEDGVLDQAAEALRTIINSSGRKVVWLISGDLAHVGKKFGDDLPAQAFIEDVKGADQRLLEHLRRASPEAYNAEIVATDHAYRICGHAPTVLALTAIRPVAGSVVAYDIWDEEETQSAVSFASVLFH